MLHRMLLAANAVVLAASQPSYEISLTSATCMQVVFRYDTSLHYAGWCKISGSEDSAVNSRPHYRDVLTATSTQTGSNTTTVCSEQPLGSLATNRRALLNCATLPSSGSTPVFVTFVGMPGLSKSKDGVVLAWSGDHYPSIGRISASTGELGLRCVEIAWQQNVANALIDRFCISNADRRLPQYPASQSRVASAGIAVRIFGDEKKYTTGPPLEDDDQPFDSGYRRSIGQRIGRMGMLMRKLTEF